MDSDEDWFEWLAEAERPFTESSFEDLLKETN